MQHHVQSVFTALFILSFSSSFSVKGMYPAPHIHEHLRYTNGYGKLRTSSRTTGTTWSTLRKMARTPQSTLTCTMRSSEHAAHRLLMHMCSHIALVAQGLALCVIPYHPCMRTCVLFLEWSLLTRLSTSSSSSSVCFVVSVPLFAMCSRLFKLCVKMYAVCRSHLCIVNVREYEVQDTFPLHFLPFSPSASSAIWVSSTQPLSRACSAALLAARQIRRRSRAVRMCGPVSTRIHQAFLHHVMCLFDKSFSSCVEFAFFFASTHSSCLLHCHFLFRFVPLLSLNFSFFSRSS